MKKSVAESLRHEEIFDLDAFDGKKIWCIVNRASHQPATRAIILSHGLTGNPTEFIHMAARDYFTALGYDVYRFAYYWTGPQYRLLRDCTLQIHAHDLNAVIAKVRGAHQKIFVCGHSYGGMTMLFANPQANAISFWDSAFDPWNEFWRDEKIDLPALNMYGIGWGSVHLIGPAMVDEARTLNAAQAAQMATALTAPAQVIIAEKGGHRGSQAIFEHHPGPKDFQEISDATHCFTDGLIVQELFDATEKWFNRIASPAS